MADFCGGLFVSGTGTGVGKTYVAALIARWAVQQGQRVGVYKPAASGGVADAEGKLVSGDAVALWQAAGCPGEFERVCPQVFALPVAPHLAAAAEGRAIDARLLRSGLDYWRQQSDIVVVEGAGGLMSPLGNNEYVADLAADFGFQLVVVAENRLGTINATLQTLITARAYRDLAVAGVVLNNTQPPANDDPSQASNRDELDRCCWSLNLAPVLTTVRHGGGLDSEVDWLAHSVARASCPQRY